MTNTEIRDFIEQSIAENEVMLFMKGTPEQPACGFSMRTSGALNALGVQYAALDILPDPRIREELSGLSGWPTIPQLFVKGELVGGCDIVTEMYETGELAEKLGVEMPEDDEEAPAPEPAAAAAGRTRMGPSQPRCRVSRRRRVRGGSSACHYAMRGRRVAPSRAGTMTQAAMTSGPTTTETGQPSAWTAKASALLNACMAIAGKREPVFS